MGPVAYWRFTDLIHGQALWWHDVIDHAEPDGALGAPGDGDLVRVGIGFVF